MQKENYCNGNILKIPLTYRSNVPADKLIALTWQEEIKNSLETASAPDPSMASTGSPGATLNKINTNEEIIHNITGINEIFNNE